MRHSRTLTQPSSGRSGFRERRALASAGSMHGNAGAAIAASRSRALDLSPLLLLIRP